MYTLPEPNYDRLEDNVEFVQLIWILSLPETVLNTDSWRLDTVDEVLFR